MDLCRICLSSNPEKDVIELEGVRKGEKVTYVDVMLFCLNIKVTEDTVTRKLCKKCFNKILRYHEFKSRALQSDIYLNSMMPCILVKNEVFIDEDKSGIGFDNNEDHQDMEAGLKCDFKEECENSEDEILKVFKQVAELKVETKDNAQEINHYPKTTMKTEKGTSQVCEECGKSVKNMGAHRLTHVPPTERFLSKCDICDKVFTSRAIMQRHRKERHMSVLQHCDICNKGVRKLQVHQRIAHNKSSLRHVCASCDKRFISQSTLNIHMLSHTNERPFACDLCPGKYKQKLILEQHIKRVHTKEKPHLCQFCSKSFFKKYHLQVHIRTHTKEKPYKCEECGRMFGDTTTLKNHLSVHSDVKKYACTLCDMTFSRNSYLIGHMAVHTREKRHPCKYCGIKFRRSDHRKRHEFTAHERHLVTAPLERLTL